jgi:hypothetical protein
VSAEIGIGVVNQLTDVGILLKNRMNSMLFLGEVVGDPELAKSK